MLKKKTGYISQLKNINIYRRKMCMLQRELWAHNDNCRHDHEKNETNQ